MVGDKGWRHAREAALEDVLGSNLETHGQGKDIGVVLIGGGCAVQWPVLQHTEELWQHLLRSSV